MCTTNITLATATDTSTSKKCDVVNEENGNNKDRSQRLNKYMTKQMNF